MKSILFPLFALALCMSCKNDPKTNIDPKVSEKPELTMEGAWELTSFYNYRDNKVVDSFNINSGYRQVKIYTDTKVMWSKNVPTDTTEWFGYGNYKLDDGHLIEVLEYGSEMMRTIIQEKKEFTYEVNLLENKFTQIELDQNGNRIYSENYKRIE